ncbi:MAG: hypothetical protein IJX90_01930 [Blautia sp.]|nr:hypothetical protein [Blautia sp.]
MEKKITLLITTILHFLVDLCCIYYVTGILIPLARDHGQYLRWVVFYNFMAFAFPALLGLLADLLVKKRQLSLAACGCFLIAAAFLLRHLPSGIYGTAAGLLPVFLLGLGNGMFHIGAGIRVMEHSLEQDRQDRSSATDLNAHAPSPASRVKYAPPGIFISSGAVGVYLGGLWGRKYLPLWNVFLVLILCAGVVLLVCDRLLKGTSAHVPPAAAEGKKKFPPMREILLPCLLLFGVVVIRSYYGSILSYGWKTGVLMGLVFTLFIVGGKFFGGIAADLMGIQRAVLLSLGAGGILALFSFSGPVPGCLSVFLFNMTMPLTLTLLTLLMPEYKGFAFGLLMLALFLGTLPTMVFDIHALFSGTGLLFLCLVSLAGLLLAVRMERSRL